MLMYMLFKHVVLNSIKTNITSEISIVFKYRVITSWLFVVVCIIKYKKGKKKVFKPSSYYGYTE